MAPLDSRLVETMYFDVVEPAIFDIWLLANFFFYLREKTIFFFRRSTSDNFFFMFRRRNFLSYAFPIMYVTIWCFFWSTYFSSISTTNFFFLPTFSTNFFFRLLWRQTIYFNFNLAPPPPVQISNGASLTKSSLGSISWATVLISSHPVMCKTQMWPVNTPSKHKTLT